MKAVHTDFTEHHTLKSIAELAKYVHNLSSEKQ